MSIERQIEVITWTDVLGTEKNKEYFQEILRRVREDEMQHTVYPRAQDRFNAFKYTEFQNLKVIILGQDPYVNPGQAHGLCFSVPDGVKPPPSLINIYKEIEDDLKIQMDYQNGNLTCWACQGVLLLNAILTVRKGEPASHRNFGWEKFTDVVLEKISIFKKHCVFMLWGEFARKKSSLIDATKHLVLTANHPSPLSADRGFFGCKHFSKCNEYLLKNNLTPINWSNKF